MIPQIKPNRWSCIPTSFAMALDMPVDEFIRKVGHDGSEIICPSLPDPAGRRGFHEQECVTVAGFQWFACTLIELFPASLFATGHKQVIEFPGGNHGRFQNHVNRARGILTGMGRDTRHAVAFDHGLICDPDTGSMFPFTFEDCESRGFFASTLWRVDRITQ